MTDETLSLPPLMTGRAVTGAIDPFEKACALAVTGCDAGVVVHNIQADRLRAALVLAPEVPLESAVTMMPLCGVGFQNALGALAPPEVAVHLGWDGGIFVNGARCGAMKMASDVSDPEAMPSWLIVGIEIPLLGATTPGDTPDSTSLYDEGCIEVEPGRLLESWTRHTLVWINRWSAGDTRALHDEWLGLVKDVGEEIEIDGETGTFLGVDEMYGMLLRDAGATKLIPLSTRLQGA